MRGDIQTITAGALALGFALACGGGAPSTTEWEVVADLEGASPEDVEQLLLEPIESALLSVGGLERLDGLAGDGTATVTLRVRGDDPTPIFEALVALSAFLPPEAMAPTLQRAGPSRWFAVAPEDAERVRWSALALPGVEDVRVHGLNPEQIVVRIDPERLAAYGVELDGLRDAFATDVTLPSGSLQVEHPEHLVRVAPSASGSIEEIEQIVVGVQQGIVVRVGDLAGIERSRAEGPHAHWNREPVVVVEILSERTDLASAVAGRPLDGWTRLDVLGSPGWATALDGPDTVTLEGGAGGTAWLDLPPEEARSRAAAIAGIRARVHEATCEEVVVSSDDLAVLAEAERAILAVPGTWSTWAPPRPEIRYTIDRDAATALGATPSEVSRAIAFAAGGRLATRRDGDEALDVVLRIDDPTALRLGGVPLGALARVEIGTSRPIPHVDARRAAVVEACGVTAAALEDVDLPPGAAVRRRE